MPRLSLPPAVNNASAQPTPLPAPETLAPLPDTPTGRYRHYKGGEYELIGVARHSETLEPQVIYRALYGDGGLWVRPHAMFFESVQVEGRLQPRFARVAAASTDR